MSEKEHEESLEYIEKRLIELIGEMRRRLKILDSVAVILEKHPDSADDKLVLDKIRSTMSRRLEARAHAKSIGKEEEKVK